MPKSESLRPFEVYCNRCNVTFPAESRHCVHCGGRLSRDSRAGHTLATRRMAMAEGEDFAPVEAEEEETPRRSPFSPVALIWIVLLAVGSIYRACTGT